MPSDNQSDEISDENKASSNSGKYDTNAKHEERVGRLVQLGSRWDNFQRSHERMEDAQVGLQDECFTLPKRNVRS
jgi:hypothetical protein